MRRFRHAISFAAIILTALNLAVAGAAAQTSGEVMRFSLTAHDGHQVSEANFAGRYMLVQFGYTWCPDVCPMELALLSEVLDHLGADAENVQPLFISFDPTRDSAAMLAEYVGNFHPAIIGLSGSEEEITRLLNAFGAIRIKEGKGQENYSYAHSAHTYLLGPNGDYRGSIESLAPPDEVAVGLVEFLRNEKTATE